MYASEANVCTRVIGEGFTLESKSSTMSAGYHPQSSGPQGHFRQRYYLADEVAIQL